MSTHVSTTPAACTRCAELEAELEADRATLDDTRAELAAVTARMHDEREKLDDALSTIVLTAAALYCEKLVAGDPRELVASALWHHDELELNRAAVTRIRYALNRPGSNPHCLAALRVLDEGLARSRGAR